MMLSAWIRPDDKCSPLNIGHQAQTSSIDAGGGCVILFAGTQCTGRNLIIKAGTPSHYDLRKSGFNDLTRAFKPC